MADDAYVKALQETGRNLARNGGSPPSREDASSYPASSVIKTAYEEEKKRQGK